MMAFTFRGIGTLQYGKRDFRPDGSYVTTLWFVCLYLPVFPISSKRVGPTGEVKYYGAHPRRTFRVTEKTRPHRTQVLSTYAFFATELAIFFTAKVNANWWIAVPGILVLGLPWLLRRQSMERMKVEKERNSMGFAPALAEDGTHRLE